nr:hypothetical protein [Babesia sp. Xinjiang]
MIIGYLITLTKAEIKEYILETYNKYVNYEDAKIKLSFYPYGSRILIKEIIKTFKKIKFKKIFTILNFIKLIDYFVTNAINRLIKFKNYDILDGVDLFVFFFEFLIDKYIYKLTEFQMVQKCQFSLRYYALWVRCFSTIEASKDNIHPFFIGCLVFSVFIIVYPPLFYAIISDIESFNTLDNAYHYFVSSTSPL